MNSIDSPHESAEKCENTAHLYPLDQPLVYTVFPDKSGQSKRSERATWQSFVARVSEPRTFPNKAATPFVKLAEFGDQRSERGSYKTGDNMGAVYGIEADYDGEQVTPAEAARRARAAGIECLIVTTSSHRADAPRWRVFCPLGQPCTWREAREQVGVLNGMLGGILAGESFTIAQGYHVGRVAGAEYEVHHVRGGAIDDDLFAMPVYPPGKEPRPEGERRAPDAPRERLTDAQIAELTTAALRVSPQRFGSSDGVHDQHVEVLRALKDAWACGWSGAQDVWLDLNSRHGTPRKQRDAQSEWDRHPVPHTSTWRSLFLLADRDDPPTLADLADGFEDEGESQAAAQDVPAVETVGAAMFDVENSRWVARRMAGKFAFEHNGRGWLVYRGGVYVPCSRGEQFEVAKLLGATLLRTAPNDPDKIGAHMKSVMRAMSVQGINAALSLAQSDPRIAVKPADFDADPDLLNVANGVIHLPTGELRPHDATLHMSRQCPVHYDPLAQAPTWTRFLRDISSATGAPDDDWVDFLQRAAGYTLSGHVREELMFFLLGVGANGKSVLSNILRHMLGNYAASVPANFLMVSQRDGEAATPSLASLAGARLALANEVEAGSRLSAQMAKVATSTDPISARHLNKPPFTFLPTHTLWVRGNHKPIVTDNDEGIWRRIVLIPFERHFTADEKDTALEAKIMAEAPGVLAWMVRGFAEYQHRGLKRARRVAAASIGYRKESDLIGQWIEERELLGAGHAWVQADAYDDYRGWCAEQGLRALAKKSLTAGLLERGFANAQEGTGLRRRLYLGLNSARECMFSSNAAGSGRGAAQDAQD